jgi:hypothetical protein
MSLHQERVREVSNRLVHDKIESRFPAILKSLHNVVSREWEAFQQVDIKTLRVKDREGDFEFRREITFEDRLHCRDERMSELLDVLQVPQWVTPEGLVDKVRLELDREDRISQGGERMTNIHSMEQVMESRILNFKGAVAALDKKEEEVLTECNPRLREAIGMLNEGLSRCHQSKEILSNYIKQPGFNEVPWWKYKGLSLQEWESRLSVLEKENVVQHVQR